MFRETKLFFESLFSDDWAQTPIHFAGQEFKADGIPQWVNVVYTPLTGRPQGVSRDTSTSLGLLSVICWAENDADVMSLADDVVAFINGNTGKYKVNNYEITDHSWQDSNQVYMYLTFNIEAYDGVCQ